MRLTVNEEDDARRWQTWCRAVETLEWTDYCTVQYWCLYVTWHRVFVNDN